MHVSGGVSGATALSGLSDVTISSPTNGQVPVYNSGTGKWENNTVSATDSTKVPLAGTASLTGPLGWSSNSGNGSSSAVWAGKDANGAIVNVGSAGGGGAFQLFSGNVLNLELNEKYGIKLSGVDHTPQGGPNYQIYRYGGQLCLNGPASGAVALQTNSATNVAFDSLGMLASSGYSIKSAGQSHAADATWRNQFSLGAGAHYGWVWVSDDAGNAALYTINNTSISFVGYHLGTAWGSADSNHRHLRVSGGQIQVYNGTGLATQYVTILVIGTVR